MLHTPKRARGRAFVSKPTFDETYAFPFKIFFFFVFTSSRVLLSPSFSSRDFRNQILFALQLLHSSSLVSHLCLFRFLVLVCRV